MSDEKDDNWEMPKPVFRSTSGSVPKNLEDTISLSLAPNKDAADVDDGDDILGIMESNYGSGADRSFGGSGSNDILETEQPTAEPTVSDSIVSDPVLASPPTSPMNVTAEDEIRRPKQIDPRRADLLTYIAMVVIGVGLFIAAVYYYFWPPPPVR